MSQEDLGVAYESYVKARYLEDLRARFSLESMLEVHCANGGEDAVVVRGLWKYVVILNRGLRWVHSSASCDLVEGRSSSMPFRSNVFDLVCGSDLAEGAPSTVKYVREMARVSSRFLLISVPNPFHLGHLIMGRLSRNARSVQSSRISVKHICEAVRKAGLKIVEIGGIDAPPWPSHLHVRNIARRSGFKWRWNISRNRRCPTIIWVLSEMEREMPRWLRALQAHITYILASKEAHANCSL